jgi:uncharacterized coiled-coil DUF342 family protein
MNRKMAGAALVLFVFWGMGTLAAQSQSAASLIKRTNELAAKCENLVKKTQTAPSTPREGNELKREFERLTDESSTLDNDLTFAGYQNITLTDDQNRSLLNAARRIENAKGQIARNISRW